MNRVKHGKPRPPVAGPNQRAPVAPTPPYGN